MILTFEIYTYMYISPILLFKNNSHDAMKTCVLQKLKTADGNSQEISTSESYNNYLFKNVR